MDYPELPIGYTIMMTADPEGTPLIAYDGQDMRAYVDADRAQRSAPGVQGGDSLSCPGCDGSGEQEHWDSVDESGGYDVTGPCFVCGGSGIAPLRPAQPPQQSAQPVAWMHETPGRVDVIHDEVKKLLSAAATDYLHRPIDKSEKYTIPLYAAAQPVEVQRVPLTNGQVSEGQDSNGLFPGSVASCAFTMGVRFAESKHGIKPTSSEGGAV